LQALLASTSKEPTLPSSPTPPSPHVRAPSPPPIIIEEIFIKVFDITLQTTMRNTLIVKNFRGGGETQVMRNDKKMRQMMKNVLMKKGKIWKPLEVLHNVGLLQCSTWRLNERKKSKIVQGGGEGGTSWRW
jgi:hypothetical protein